MTKSVFLIAVAFFFLLQVSSCLPDTNVWESVTLVYQDASLPHLKPFSRLLENVLKDVPGVSKECKESLSLFRERLLQKRTDAVLLFDSWGRLGSGSFRQRPTDFGHYRQCLRTKLSGTFESRYLLLKTNFPSGKPLNPEYDSGDFPSDFNAIVENGRPFYRLNAICVPNSCSVEDVEDILKSKVITDRLHPIKLEVFTSETEGEDPFEETRVYHNLALLVILSLVTITVYSSVTKNSNNNWIACFDVKENNRRLMSPPKGSNYDPLGYIYFITMLVGVLTVMGHSFYTSHPSYMPVMWSLFTFLSDAGEFFHFSLSSVVIAVIIMCSSVFTFRIFYQNGRNVSLGQFIFAKLARVVPILLTVIILKIAMPSLIPSHGMGPLFSEIHRNQSLNCLHHGWKDLLFFSNGIDYYHMCSPVTWWVSVDMQCFFLFVIPMFTFNWSEKIGVILTLTMSVFGVLVNFHHLNEIAHIPLYPFFYEITTNVGDIVKLTYFNTRAFIPSYGFGILLAYYFLSKKSATSEPEKNRNLESQGHTKTSVLLAVAFVSAYIYSIYLFATTYDTFGRPLRPRIIELIIGTLLRTILVITFMGMSYFGFMRTKRQLKFYNSKFLVLSTRSMLSIYLCHPIIISFLIGERQQVIDYTALAHVKEGVLTFLLSIPLSYFLMMIVEFPSVNLAKLIISRWQKTPVTSLKQGREVQSRTLTTANEKHHDLKYKAG